MSVCRNPTPLAVDEHVEEFTTDDQVDAAVTVCGLLADGMRVRTLRALSDEGLDVTTGGMRSMLAVRRWLVSTWLNCVLRGLSPVCRKGSE